MQRIFLVDQGFYLVNSNGHSTWIRVKVSSFSENVCKDLVEHKLTEALKKESSIFKSVGTRKKAIEEAMLDISIDKIMVYDDLGELLL